MCEGGQSEQSLCSGTSNHGPQRMVVMRKQERDGQHHRERHVMPEPLAGMSRHKVQRVMGFSCFAWSTPGMERPGFRLVLPLTPHSSVIPDKAHSPSSPGCLSQTERVALGSFHRLQIQDHFDFTVLIP